MKNLCDGDETTLSDEDDLRAEIALLHRVSAINMYVTMLLALRGR